MNQTTIDYGMRTRLDVPYEAAVERVTAALKTEGFGVLTTIDVQSTLKQKLDVEFRRYIILGACNPPLAHRALSTELEIGLLLPCNVIVHDDGNGRSKVSVMDPSAAMGLVGSDSIAAVAAEARETLERALEHLRK